eukprot:8479565-Alexandrium_andersonii.AAC.1
MCHTRFSPVRRPERPEPIAAARMARPSLCSTHFRCCPEQHAQAQRLFAYRPRCLGQCPYFRRSGARSVYRCPRGR